MAKAEDLQELIPGTTYREGDEDAKYWICNGTLAWGYDTWMPAAEAVSFSFYRGSFGKDRKHCYCQFRKLSGGRPETFRALNYTYYTDGATVWALGGKLQDADAASFVACDDGVYYLFGGRRVPHGFGKDKNRVFFYDFDGKPNWVRKASAGSFMSLNDGYFGRDDRFVFCGAFTLPNARLEHWIKLGGAYSKDDASVFHMNKVIKEADPATFEVVRTVDAWRQLARDKSRRYVNGREIDALEFEKLVAR